MKHRQMVLLKKKGNNNMQSEQVLVNAHFPFSLAQADDYHQVEGLGAQQKKASAQGGIHIRPQTSLLVKSASKQ